MVPEHDTKSIMWFNDHKDTRYMDVIAVLRLAVRTGRQHQLFISNIVDERLKKSLFKERHMTPQEQCNFASILKSRDMVLPEK